MESINIHAAKTNLSHLLQRVENGEDIVISRNGKPLAHLIPYKEKSRAKPRRGGQWTGKIKLAPAYGKNDAEIESLFNNGDIFPKT